ncbi:uncharacterized protein LOC133529314 [Cydia pomonella]|uniref:uncharacterized protein LOC133529314 n=1 Tax=Cydia pomonella TaxID=82600 RepID=UPI002ADE59E2|nr:uncharacterized protein LOC133529314 [Cydia pomonella]
MSKLLQQQACFESIKSLCANYKKDSADRKTRDYLNKRLANLDALWDKFESQHGVLETEIEDKNITYFQEDIHTKTKNMYDVTKADMLNLIHKLTEANSSVQFDLTERLEGTETGTSDVIQLLSKQECNFKAIDRAMSKIAIAPNNEKWELEDNLNILKSKWTDIDKQHWEIDGLLKGAHETYYNIFTDIENRYDSMRKDLNSKIWTTSHYQKSAPRISIPEFSGNYNQWISFKDLFVETVHNNPTINKAQKMQHLKTKLRGEAERLVQHLTINADNYNSCWDILNQRYDNRRLQFTSFMNTMLNLPTIQQPDAYNLKKMHDVITECLSGLTNIGLDTTTWDPIIVHLMTLKLDASTHSDYVRDLQDHREVPVLHDFLYFLESKFMAYETMKRAKKDVITQQKQASVKTFSKEYQTKKPNYNNFNYFKNNFKTYHATHGQCPLCEGGHSLRQCQRFVDLDIPQRNNMVAKLKVCKNCLSDHGDRECGSQNTCKECNMKHHSLLHNNNMKKQIASKYTKFPFGPKPSTSTQQPTSHHIATNEVEVLLTTVQLQLQASNGTFTTLRALLDQGSQLNLITENAAQLLNLPRKKLNGTITGIGTLTCKGKAELKGKSLHSDYTFQTKAFIVRKITRNLPNSTFKKADWPHIQNLKLADPDFDVSRPIDLLLGAHVYADALMNGLIKAGKRAPIAQQTQLGWIISGSLTTPTSPSCHAALTNMDELTKFWENEDISQNDADRSTDDKCEDYYQQTVKRGPDGKYIVKMPLNAKYEKKLGNSKQIAISQFLQLERKLQRQPKFAQMYREFMKEYSDLQHMKPSKSSSAQDCYLPHHGVLRAKASTTKLRVVYNASQKTSSGYSLNSLQEKGPNLQRDIQALILKWRSYKYAFCADVQMMYRCIWISEDQQHLQKIIWRNSPSEKLQEYQLCTVTYGQKCAGWLATRTLKQLAIDDGHKHPEAAETLKNEFYVDDLISGRNSIEEAKELQSSLISLLKGGGMNLRKWSANDPTLLEDLTKDQISTQIYDFKHEESMKTLGLGWNPSSDTFLLSWELQNDTASNLTKRTLLSEISRLYDPLGWYSPVTVTAKLIFQRVWTSNISWDQILPHQIQEDWIKLKTELQLLNKVNLNRWIGGTSKQIELLGFSDASEKAFACVIYTRVKDDNGKLRTTLLAAKTRVAPISQKTTLPKLELCGTLLLAQLMKKVLKAYKDYDVTIRAFCDSQVTLAWLQGDESRWEKYVANRVVKVTQIIPADKWNYIRSEENPSDCASRGVYPSKLVNLTLWWHGPSLPETNLENELQTSTCHFTTNIGLAENEETTLTTNQNNNFMYDLLNKCSSLSRAIVT